MTASQQAIAGSAIFCSIIFAERRGWGVQCQRVSAVSVARLRSGFVRDPEGTLMKRRWSGRGTGARAGLRVSAIVLAVLMLWPGGAGLWPGPGPRSELTRLMIDR